MKNQMPKIECPECGCGEIHVEYGNYGSVLLSRVCKQTDEDISTEPVWCYCLCCGVMFNPEQEAFAV